VSRSGIFPATAGSNLPENFNYEVVMSNNVNEAIDIETDETIDLEECAKADRRPPRARRYRIRIDREHFIVEVPYMTGRELLTLAGKTPVTNYLISQKFRGGQAIRIGLDEKADFTTPGVERFMTLPLDQTEGC
jgi:hypothetical protein